MSCLIHDCAPDTMQGSPLPAFQDVPAIAVVMPVYNAAATLRATVASVRGQSLANWELIAVDDGSSDESLTLLLDEAAADWRIRVVSKPNGGVSAARNMGAQLARAPLVAFLDADDLWAPGKLAAHVALHDARPVLGASYARIAFIAPDADTLAGAQTTSTLCPHKPGITDVLGENPVCTASNFVVRRDRFLGVGGFDETLSHAEDQEILARLITRGATLDGIDAVLTGYRLSAGGLSMDLDRMHAGWRAVVARYLPADQAIALDALYCRYMARRVLRGGGRPLRALAYALRGLWLAPRAFFAQPRRGIATLAASLAALAMPARLRLRLFA